MGNSWGLCYCNNAVARVVIMNIIGIIFASLASLVQVTFSPTGVICHVRDVLEPHSARIHGGTRVRSPFLISGAFDPALSAIGLVFAAFGAEGCQWSALALRLECTGDSRFLLGKKSAGGWQHRCGC